MTNSAVNQSAVACWQGARGMGEALRYVCVYIYRPTAGCILMEDVYVICCSCIVLIYMMIHFVCCLWPPVCRRHSLSLSLYPRCYGYFWHNWLFVPSSSAKGVFWVRSEHMFLQCWDILSRGHIKTKWEDQEVYKLGIRRWHRQNSEDETNKSEYNTWKHQREVRRYN